MKDLLFSRKPLHVIYLAGFLFSAHIAFTTYINSSFLSSGCGCGIPENVVGILFTLGSLLAIIGLSYIPIVINAMGNRKTFIILLMMTLLSLGFMIGSSHPYIVGLAFIIYLAVGSLVFFTIDIFVEHYSDNKTTGKTRGIFLTVVNLAWVLSPLIVGRLIDTSHGFVITYGIGFLLTTLVLLIFSFSLRKYTDGKYAKLTLLKTVQRFWREKDLRNIFMATFILQFFYSWMVIYTPIYLNQHLGMSWTDIGMVFTIMLIPFVIFELPLGKLADNRYGEKEILSVGIIIMALATGVIPFITSTTVWLWALVLFATRVGASFIQIMTESYFFKHVDANDMNFIGVFRDASPLAYIVGPLVATLILTIFGIEFRYLFLILAIIVLYGLRYSLALKDTK